VKPAPSTDAADTEAFVHEIERAIALWLFEQRHYPNLIDAIAAVGSGAWRAWRKPVEDCPKPVIVV